MDMDLNSASLSPVEQIALNTSPYDRPYYPATEKIPVLTVGNFPALGKLVAMRFLEWVQSNPGGVIALPTGKTPEHFIHWVTHLLKTWDEPATQAMLQESGIDPSRKPEMRGLHFVQIDEFYPIHPSQKNSFYSYVNKFYLDGFQLDPAKALLMNCAEIGLERDQTLDSVWPLGRVDLSLRTRQAETGPEKTQQAVLRRVDQWCQEFEQRIRDLGGIGFFLGGIGPDGHIGFNIRGSDHFSTTRLMATNYETQAAAATDLGGLEVARNRLVITIGLGTLTANPNCAAIIMAAGEAKAGIVADAVQDPASVLIPASALRCLPAARFYLTQGAARNLRERQVRLLTRCEHAQDVQVEWALVDLAVAREKRILDLTEPDVQSDPIARETVARRPECLETLKTMVYSGLVAKIEAGSQRQQNVRFLHTEPHHDDLMLGCLPYIVRNIRDATNVHNFVTLTSGFTAVTNQYMLAQFQRLKSFLGTPKFVRLHTEGYFEPNNLHGRNRDIWQYLDGIAAHNVDMRDEGAARRMLRNLLEAYDETDVHVIADRIEELEHYFRTIYPGKKDLGVIQGIKGMCREWEAECLWGYFGWESSHINHLRLGFYTGDIFSPTPTVERDVLPIVKLLEQTRPDVISVAFDPEASGPDTHYKVLQAVNEATQQYAHKSGYRDLRVIGYRNVWYRFHPAEANLYVPVSLNMFSVMETAFMNTFVSQRDASFPSHELDGPFCALAQKIQVQQYQVMKTCLGREWFAEHSSPLIRAVRGLVFLREMGLEEFSHTARKLREAAEAVRE
ncbi:MAG: glucosamine-6-phosphate deaminase [Planctomycetota bacterium]